MLGTLTASGLSALDWLPSVAIAGLVVAALHLVYLMKRYAAIDTAPAGHSPGEIEPAAPANRDAIEHQNTLDSATSLERKSLSSPPSASFPKDMDIPASVKRASNSGAMSGIPILAPRTPSAAGGQTSGLITDTSMAQTDSAAPARPAAASERSQQQQQMHSVPAGGSKGPQSGNGALYRPGSAPSHVVPLSPTNTAHNMYLVSISDDYVAPLHCTLHERPASAEHADPRCAAAPGRQRKLQTLAPVPSASDEGGSAAVSRTSSATSAHGRTDTTGTSPFTGAAAAAEEGLTPAALNSQAASRLDLGPVREQLQQQQMQQQEGCPPCGCHQEPHTGNSADPACKLLPDSGGVPPGPAPPTSGQPPAAVRPVPPAASSTTSVRVPRPSALYTSPMQHITVSVKVPNPHAPVTAHSLQNIVAQHVISAAAAQQPPQHTIMHMVSVPGCIQLLMSVVNWQGDQQVPAAAAGGGAVAPAAPAATAWGMSYSAPLPTAAVPAGSGLGDPVQSLTVDLSMGTDFVRSAVVAAPVSTVTTGPAPGWMVGAVCAAVQEFMHVHGRELAAAHDGNANTHLPSGPVAEADSRAVTFQPCTPGSAPTAQRQGGHGINTPVLIDINGQKFSMLPGPNGPAGEWQLQEVESPAAGTPCFGGAPNWTTAAAGTNMGFPSHARAALPSPSGATSGNGLITTATATTAADGNWPLPDGVWAWPLCLPTTDHSSSGVNNDWQPVSQPLPAAAAAGGVIAVHGLTESSVRLVATDASGQVLADCTCQLVNGVARIQPAASSKVDRCTIYCVTQSTSSAVPPAASVYFALPVLYLPEAVVSELHEAARKIMLEQSRAHWLQMQQDPAAVTDAASYLYYYMSDVAAADGNSSASAGAHAETGVATRLTPQASNKISGSSIDSGSGGSRHWGSFTTQRSQRTAGPAARVSLFDDEAPAESQLQQRQRQRSSHVQHSCSSGVPSDSGSSKQTFEEEDAQHRVSLRGRLFEGDDVHQLLQQQFLAVISDMGLLVDLAAAAAAGGATATAAPVAVHTTEIAVTIGDGREPRRAPASVVPSEVTRVMASSVGQQLLLWAGNLDCWSCCRQVLSLLLDIGIELAMNGSLITRDQVATVADVQALLLGGDCPQPAGPVSGSAATAATMTSAAIAAAAGRHTLHASAAAAAKVARSGGQLGCGSGAPLNVVTPAQQQMHHMWEGHLTGAGSSQSPVPCWDHANNMGRGRNSVDNSRARDQARAAAAAAIAGNMPGSAALGRKRSGLRSTGSEAGSSVTSGSGSPAALSRAASGRLATAAGGSAHGAPSGSEYGSASSAPPVPTLRSVGPTSDEASAAARMTSAGPTDMDSADMLAGQREHYKTHRRYRMSIKDSASEVFSRLMRRKSSSSGRKGGVVGDELEVSQAAATVEQ